MISIHRPRRRAAAAAPRGARRAYLTRGLELAGGRRRRRRRRSALTFRLVASETMMTPKQGRAWKRELERELKRDAKAKARAELRQLREELKRARAAHKGQI